MFSIWLLIMYFFRTFIKSIVITEWLKNGTNPTCEKDSMKAKMCNPSVQEMFILLSFTRQHIQDLLNFDKENISHIMSCRRILLSSSVINSIEVFFHIFWVSESKWYFRFTWLFHYTILAFNFISSQICLAPSAMFLTPVEKGVYCNISSCNALAIVFVFVFSFHFTKAKMVIAFYLAESHNETRRICMFISSKFLIIEKNTKMEVDLSPSKQRIKRKTSYIFATLLLL